MTDGNESLIAILKAKGSLTSGRVEEALRKTPRGVFVPQDESGEAYKDIPLPIGEGQTISQPSVVARMTEWLDPHPGDRVLEIGTGSGWQSAILACLVGPEGQVYTTEYREELKKIAAARLKKQGIQGVEVVLADGSTGLPEYSPYHRIICTAACPSLPQEWVDQLSEDGLIVAPIGGPVGQALVCFTKKEGRARELKREYGYRFVPLIGEKGQESWFFYG